LRFPSPRLGQPPQPRGRMPRRGSLGVQAKRCSREPWPGSGWNQSGSDAGAVAIRVRGRGVLRAQLPSPPRTRIETLSSSVALPDRARIRAKGQVADWHNRVHATPRGRSPSRRGRWVIASTRSADGFGSLCSFERLFVSSAGHHVSGVIGAFQGRYIGLMPGLGA
jgi:hypothetical protein